MIAEIDEIGNEEKKISLNCQIMLQIRKQVIS